MRAVCESCAGRQPVDWRPGDLCTQCGLAVREETRCFWCAKWGPNAKFCRKCGAAAVARDHYGPARMLKHLGASVFEIPKLLHELDPDLIATYQSLYGAHAAAASRHVERAREISKALYQKHWANDLEDELTPQLPWSDEKLARSADNPPDIIQDLAALARIQQGDFSNLRETAHLVNSPNPAIAAEAALQFSGWRALYCTYTEINRHMLMDVLRQSPLPVHAAPRLAALGAQPEPSYVITGDPDTDFLVIILDRSIRALEDNLASPDSQRRFVAATHLVRLKHASAIGPVLRAATKAQQLELLRDIVRTKNPIPRIHDDLFALVETSDDYRIPRTAAQAIALARCHADFVRLADGDAETIQSLFLARPAPETYLEIGWRLVTSGRFKADQWGLDEAAKPGAMPLTFVEDLYPNATPETQAELLRFAEKQIEAHAKPHSALERFLIRQCFASAPVELIGTAWSCMHRIQMHRKVGLIVPCDLSLENVAWCWTVPEILSFIGALMANPKAVNETFVRDDFDCFLRSAGPEFFAATAGYPSECQRVRQSAKMADPYLYAVRFAAALST